jgi:hypothetical protein
LKNWLIENGARGHRTWQKELVACRLSAAPPIHSEDAGR